MDSSTGRAGLIHTDDGAGSMDELAHSVLDDVLYNIISDLVLKTHREEKTARASTAAIRVEKLASDASDSSTPDSRPDIKVETDAAIYEDGRVTLKGNPLQTTADILCTKCHLPRLLHPTDGKGARKPDPTILYCKKQPYIEKADCDIYGQSWVGPGPGRGKKKKDMEKKSDDAHGPDSQRPANVLSFPSATCSKCKRCILVTRLNNHMGSCIGNSGRNASRAAAQKLNNGNNNHSGLQNHDATPPSSQKATPGPGSRASSPRKRELSDHSGDDDELDDNNHYRSNHQYGSHHQTKKTKLHAGAGSGSTPSTTTKKVIIKTKSGGLLKKEKLKPGSHLKSSSNNSNHKNNNNHHHDDDDDDYDELAGDSDITPKSGSVKVKGIVSPTKKLKLSQPVMSSPLSKKGAISVDDSDSSDTLSTPPLPPQR